MTERAISPSSARVSVDEFWSRLNDHQLQKVSWTTPDPRSLENVHPRIPADLPDFIIELEYQLVKGVDEPVACAHCPHHQPHWHGFVLLAADGKRYLLGSHCGPKAYASDFYVAKGARRQARQRAEALVAWARMQERIPCILSAIAEAQRSPTFTAVRRFRGGWLGSTRELTNSLRALPRDQLTGAIKLRAIRSRRDNEAEAHRRTIFMQEYAKLADLPNKAHRKAVAELRERIGAPEVWVTEEAYFGHFEQAEWLLGGNNPFRLLDDVAARLRGYNAVGRTTQQKKTAEIERLIRDTKRDLEIAEQQIALVYSSRPFFTTDHLSRLSDWSRCMFASGERSITLDGGSLALVDGFSYVRLQIPASFERAGDLAAELIAEALGRDTCRRPNVSK